MSVYYRITCDDCGQKSHTSLYLMELRIGLQRKGWKHEPSANPAVMATDYCPGCQGIPDKSEAVVQAYEADTWRAPRLSTGGPDSLDGDA